MRNGKSNLQNIEQPEIASENLETIWADILDKRWPSFRCGQTEYAASATLKLVDEVAYKQGLNDFIDRNWKEHPCKKGYYVSR